MARRLLPSLRLLHEQPHQKRHGRGQQAEEEHVAPRHFGAAGEVHALHLIGDDRREEQPDRRGGVQQRARFDAAVFRNDFGDHRRAGRPLAADAERRDDAEEHERRHVRRERARRRSNRIHHHRQQQRARAAEPIGDAAEDDAADGPADQQQRREDSGPLKRRGSRGRSAERDIQQHGHRVRRHVVEEQAVENIEAPSQPGGKQHRPLVGVHVEQCPSGRCRHGIAGAELPRSRDPLSRPAGRPHVNWSEDRDSNTLCGHDKGSSRSVQRWGDRHHHHDHGAGAPRPARGDVGGARSRSCPSFSPTCSASCIVGIYWNNHHHMLHAADRINGTVLWANLHLLFWLSLVPFVTGWMGQNHFDTDSQRRLRHRPDVRGNRVLHPGAHAHRRAGTRFEAGARHRPRSQRARCRCVLYAIAIGLSFVNSWIAVAIYVGVALMWLVPDRRIEADVAGSRSVPSF